MTAMTTALEKAGISKIDMRAFAWAKEFIEANGSRGQWLAAFDRASTQLRSEGRSKRAIGGQTLSALTSHLINRVPPVREPSKGAIAAAGSVRGMLAKTVLDTVKTSDGRAWGDVGAHELDGMTRDGAIAQAIKNRLGPLSNAQRFKTVRELMRADQFEEARREAANV